MAETRPPGWEPLTASGAPPGWEPAAPPSPPDTHGVIPGAILDTLGLTKRPGAVPLTGAPGTKTPLGVALNPQTPLEHLARLAIVAPALGAVGALAGTGATAAGLPAVLTGAAPIAARIAASGALGAGSAAASGESALWGGILDAAVAGLTEGVVAGLPRLRVPFTNIGIKAQAEPVRASRAALEHATRAPGEALERIAARLPKGKWLMVPSLSGQKLTVEDAVKQLSGTMGPQYQQARGEIISELSRLDIQRVTGPKPWAGALFRKWTTPERFVAPESGTGRLALAALRASQNPAVRAAADAAMTAPVGSPAVPVGLPLAILGGQAAYNRLPAWMQP